ncbi:hypothetical protein [Paraburkholderia sp. J8-2]|uniref:hypothetical protein n=1 Tax=Paraburkholderia sp. J8-2 TaxID=2805440 RepID=UPI002AB6A180|nr:hypothetical protein [Paraburkholderia sp. J8-2]
MEKDDVFTIFDDLRKRILNIDDKNPTPQNPNIRLTLMPMALPVSGDQFRNPARPGDMTGATDAETAKRKAAAYELSRFVDRKLLMDGSGQFVPVGSLISETWDGIVHAATPAGDVPVQTEKTKARLDAAEAVLYTVKDGHTLMTPAFEDYKKYEKLYSDALTAYSDKYNSLANTPHGLDNWPTAGRAAYLSVESAMDDWVTLGRKAEVSAASDTLDAEGANAVDYIIKKCRDTFESYQFAVADTGAKYAYTACIPQDWAEPMPGLTGWNNYSYRSTERRSEHSVETHNWGAHGGLSFGFFSIGGGGGGSSRTEHGEFDSQATGIRMSYGLVTIDRPWLRTILLNIKGWGLSGQKAGVVSSGEAGQDKRDLDAFFLPSIPTHMIVIKQLGIYVGDQGQVLDELTKHSGGGGGFGWGPFSLGGSTGDDSYKQTVMSHMEDGWLVVDGAQVIGWVLEVTPRSPSEDA